MRAQALSHCSPKKDCNVGHLTIYNMPKAASLWAHHTSNWFCFIRHCCFFRSSLLCETVHRPQVHLLLSLFQLKKPWWVPFSSHCLLLWNRNSQQYLMQACKNITIQCIVEIRDDTPQQVDTSPSLPLKKVAGQSGTQVLVAVLADMNTNTSYEGLLMCRWCYTPKFWYIEFSECNGEICRLFNIVKIRLWWRYSW